MAAVRPDEGESPGEAGPAGRPGESLEELFVALEGSLLGYALRLLKDRDMAEDIVQEAFLQLHRQPPGSVRQPRSWLYRTVHNLALNDLRAGARIVPLPDSAATGAHRDEGDPAHVLGADPADPQPLPDEHLARWEGIGLVRLGLRTLDGRTREVVRLRFQEGLSYKDIGARTGLTSGNVGYLLHHALKSLADELTRAGLLR